jgi:hypothetical protein
MTTKNFTVSGTGSKLFLPVREVDDFQSSNVACDLLLLSTPFPVDQYAGPGK